MVHAELIKKLRIFDPYSISTEVGVDGASCSNMRMNKIVEQFHELNFHLLYIDHNTDEQRKKLSNFVFSLMLTLPQKATIHNSNQISLLLHEPEGKDQAECSIRSISLSFLFVTRAEWTP